MLGRSLSFFTSKHLVSDSENLILLLIVRAKDVVLTGLAETGDAMLLAAEFVTELKVVHATLDALVAGNGKVTTAPEQAHRGIFFELV